MFVCFLLSIFHKSIIRLLHPQLLRAWRALAASKPSSESDSYLFLHTQLSHRFFLSQFSFKIWISSVRTFFLGNIQCQLFLMEFDENSRKGHSFGRNFSISTQFFQKKIMSIWPFSWDKKKIFTLISNYVPEGSFSKLTNSFIFQAENQYLKMRKEKYFLPLNTRILILLCEWGHQNIVWHWG